MGIGQTIKNVAGGVGSAVRKVSKAVDKPFEDTPDKPSVSPVASSEGADANGDGTVTPVEKRAWELAGHALTPTTEGGVAGFNLPDIENPTDAQGNPNPFFIPKTRKGKGGVDEPNPDYVDASQTHQAINEYDRIMRENNPHIDYAKEYANIAAEQQANAKTKPRGNALSSFLIGLGGGPAAQRQYATTNASADQADTDAQEKALQFKKSIVDAHVKQLVEEGQWQKALKQNEASTNLERRLGELTAARAHQNKMEETAQLMGGRLDVANVGAAARIRAVQERITGVAHQTGLNGPFLVAFQKEMAKNLAGLTKGIMNDPESGLAGIPDILGAAEEIATRLKAEQDKAPTTPAAGGKMVQMYKDGVARGTPISPDDFKKRGGAAAATAHGYTFKLQ